MEKISILTLEDLLNLLETSEAAIRAHKVDYLDVLGGYPPLYDQVLGNIDQVHGHLKEYINLRNLKNDDMIFFGFDY